MMKVKVTCGACRTSMLVDDAPNDECSGCPEGEHAHVRCRYCSPAGWFAVLTIVTPAYPLPPPERLALRVVK